VRARLALGQPGGDLHAGTHRGLDDEAVVVAVHLAESLVDVAQADAARRADLAGQDAAQQFRVHADAVVLYDDQSLGTGVLGGDADVALVGLALQTVLDGVLDEGLQAEEGQRDREYLGAGLQGAVDPPQGLGGVARALGTADPGIRPQEAEQSSMDGFSSSTASTRSMNVECRSNSHAWTYAGRGRARWIQCGCERDPP
jgi:hypothetical protein